MVSADGISVQERLGLLEVLRLHDDDPVVVPYGLPETIGLEPSGHAVGVPDRDNPLRRRYVTHQLCEIAIADLSRTL